MTRRSGPPAGTTIRAERGDDPADRAAIRAVYEAAFPTSAEADLVDAVRAAGDLVPAYSLVAEQDGRVVGHLLLSPVEVVTGGGLVRVPALAPMAVLPEVQRRGIGSALVWAALDAAEAHDERLVLVVGHPWFYPRFGFRPASRYGLEPPFEVADAAFMAKPLTTYRRELRGRVRYPPAFAGS